MMRVALPLLLLAACVTAAMVPTGSAPAAVTRQLQPLVLGWEQYFKLDWEAGERDGHPVVFGHIYNRWGWGASRVQLLAEGLDGAGQVTEQQVWWLGFLLTPGTTAPFEVPLAERAVAYRVSVFAWDWIQRGRSGHF